MFKDGTANNQKRRLLDPMQPADTDQPVWIFVYICISLLTKYTFWKMNNPGPIPIHDKILIGFAKKIEILAVWEIRPNLFFCFLEI